MTTETYKFHKGEQLHLDEIYKIQAVSDSDWWGYLNDDPDTDQVLITRTVTIKITVTP